MPKKEKTHQEFLLLGLKLFQIFQLSSSDADYKLIYLLSALPRQKKQKHWVEWK